MTGIQFVTDEKGRTVAVQIDLRRQGPMKAAPHRSCHLQRPRFEQLQHLRCLQHQRLRRCGYPRHLKSKLRWHWSHL